MSVINQMLKELEDRNDPKPNQSTMSASNTPPVGLSKKTLLVIILVILLINMVAIYGWSLYTENKALKQTVLHQTEDLPSTTFIPNIKPIHKNEENSVVSIKTENTPAQTTTSIDGNTLVNEALQTDENKVQTTQQTIKKVNEEQSATVDKKAINQQPSENIIKEDNVVIEPLNKYVSYSEPQKESITKKPAQKKKQGTLSISRSHLSAEQVVKNKLQKAERAITDNDIVKAEKLFEDVLLIKPEHKDARKQLSALWFGRKLYRPALNLLSQGINIYPNDIDFRLMKARILLNQNNNKEALSVLNGYATAQDVEYQVLLANTAQLVNHTDSTLLAYRQLVNLEPHKGKWWMGLAVALDRDSQFEQANTAYKMALSTQSLSTNSVEFIKQRISELGE